MRKLLGLIFLVAAAACSSGSSGGSTGTPEVDGVPLMPGFNPGPAPAAGTGFQIVLPAVSNIEAGGSYEYCTWTNVVLDQDVWVKESIGHQTETGHHVIVYYTVDPQPPTTRICLDSDSAGFRFAIGAAGEGVAQDNILPGDLAVHIPKGAQIIVNHHYLNAGEATVAQAQSSVEVLYAAPGEQITQTSSLAFVDTAMSLPPGLSSVDILCTLNNTYAAWQMRPHMHAWGSHITIDHISGSTTDRLFDVDWAPDYAFQPPTTDLPPTQPYTFQKGDQIHVHCDYNNTTSAALTFGQEMCVFYAQDVDPDHVGNMECDQNTWGSF
jgi:hypothetical protein